MTNQLFCYWLQGYFEISRQPFLSKNHIHIIIGKLNKINEEKGSFTQWLTELCEHFIKYQCRQAKLDYFFSIIQKNLNAVFVHVIDPSYETTYAHDEILQIHSGELTV